MKLKFKFLTGDVNWLSYGGKWVSKRLNNGEFNYWLVIELIKCDGRQKYNVSLSCVSPEQAGQENINKACQGWDPMPTNPLCFVEALHSYGIHALLWQANGSNAHKLLKQARHEAMITSSFTFGFAMDRPVNRIGTTGWEALRGDITAGLTRTIASGSTEGQILGKMHGIV